MYRVIPILACLYFLLCSLSAEAQVTEFANWSRTSTTAGSGSFSNVTFPSFTYSISPSGNIRTHAVDNSETFNGANTFESTYGEADNEENLNLGVNGNSTADGNTDITETINLTINFSSATPSTNWAFCIIDIDVDQAVISATTSSGSVSNATINSWFQQVFDANSTSGGADNIPQWDATNAAILGNSNPSYTTYSDQIQTGISDNEAGGAWFEPNVALTSLSIQFEAISTATATYHLYIAAEEILLPLNLTKFVAQEMASGVEVKWETADEQGADRFVLERSSDGTHFSTLFSMPAKNVEGASYKFEDHNPVIGFNYYRLKQIDVDGTIDVSEIRLVDLNLASTEQRVFISPNPARTYFDLSWTDELGDDVQVGIYNMHGQLLHRMLGQNHQRIYSGDYNLVSGMYLLRIKGKEKTLARKVLMN